MAKLVKEEMYVKSNAAGNNNKFWEIKLYDDFSVHIRNGRVGGNGQIQTPKEFGSMEDAEAFWDKKTKEKLSSRKGYTKFKGILTESNEVNVTSSQNLADIALKQINLSSCSETASLIKYLTKKNIHNITSATTITYNADSGLLKTPLGIVTQEGLDEARLLNPFMLIADAAMGKYYVPKHYSEVSSRTTPMTGYDSTFAKANKSGVRNNEMIIYDLAQCNINFLVEFSG